MKTTGLTGLGFSVSASAGAANANTSASTIANAIVFFIVVSPFTFFLTLPKKWIAPCMLLFYNNEFLVSSIVLKIII